MSPAGDAAAAEVSAGLDAQSRRWLSSLDGAAAAAVREQALAELHALLLRAAQAELRRRSGAAGIDARERDDLAHQAAGDAVLAIAAKLQLFRGDSRFTTWAYKFVILEVSAKLARHYRRNPSELTGEQAWEHIPDRLGADPAGVAESRDLVGALRRAIDEVLSDRQRAVFVALVVDGIPLDALAAELGSTRNALYKTMFDARRKIRAHLVANGYLEDEGSRTT